MTSDTLLTPHEVDDLLRYPPGRSARLARRGVLEHVVLPDGAVRFERSMIERLLRPPVGAVEKGGRP